MSSRMQPGSTRTRRRAASISSTRCRYLLKSMTTAWFTQHGYPWAVVDVASSDTLESAVTARVRVDHGPRARIDSIRIET
mgnify:CR=1 FL=1